MKKQAKIIFYATDQSTTCVAEDTNTNPFKDKVEEERKKGNYYGLSPYEYKKLLEAAGYEWVYFELMGDYGTYIHEASKGYEFDGPFKNCKVGDTLKW